VRIDILTIFPQIFASLLDYSIIGRAGERGLVDIRLHDIRTYTHDKHHIVDDYTFGGGPGMVLKPEPIFEAVESITKELGVPTVPTILLSPQGRLFSQKIAQQLANYQRFILICGRYEGVDERVAEHLANEEISVGDYVLSGGEVAAMVMVDCVVRLIPGAVGSEESIVEDSHSEGLLEYPQYTRPAEYRDWAVPAVLLSGNHGQIAHWRRQQSLLRTAKRRPDLLGKAVLSEEDKIFLNQIGAYKN
jgi:tRNA (guanine37-N1)-methyltransferase